MAAIKVLLADDEEGVLEIMARKIEASGYGVVTADNGLTAWEKIQKEEPDIIILDIAMPGLDGLQVLKKVRTNPNAKKWQPVIIVSSMDETNNLKAGFDLEADHYLTKPCRIEDILKAIRLMVALIPLRNA